MSYITSLQGPGCPFGDIHYPPVVVARFCKGIMGHWRELNPDFGQAVVATLMELPDLTRGSMGYSSNYR